MSNSFSSAVISLDLPKILQRIESYASSELGKEAAHKLEPSTDYAAIDTELNRVSEMRRLIDGEGSFPIDGIKDIRNALHRSTVENSILSAKDLLDIATTLSASRAIKNYIDKRKEYLIELYRLTFDISIHKEIEFNIFQAINETGDVKDSASRELKNIRQEINQKQLLIRKALEKILRASAEQGMTQDEIVTTRDGRMVIPIKAELKNKFPGFIHSTSASGQTVFIEPSETLTFNNDICELIFKEKREVERILRDLTSQIRVIQLEISKIVKVLQTIDLCYAKARYSIEIKANKPFIKETGAIVVLNGYHPLLLLRHPHEAVVPLQIEIGQSFNTLLITGPNAGGKTVALKSIGILVLMVQCGIHIPVSADSEFPVFTELFVLIGDNQSIENDLSTFSSQVLDLKNLSENARKGSLVLIDEIGSNTDPTEGGAIAASILELLTEKEAITIATSHQAALKAFVHNSKGMENGAMEFDQESLLPTYHLKLGLPGSSYALEIAERLGLDEGIIKRSRELLGDQKTKLEQLILELEFRSQELKNKLQQTDISLLNYKELTQEYESKLKNLHTEIRELKKKAVEEAKTIIERASSQIESAIKEIKDQQASKDAIKSGKNLVADFENELKKMDEELLPPENELKKLTADLHEGDLVSLKSGGQVGTVVSLPDRNGNLFVALNSIKAKVNVNSVSPISKTKAKQFTTTSSFSIDKEFFTEVDVRGMYGDEAEKTVDKFLDDAVLSGIHRIDIIHGKGTGALRKRIQFFLENDPRIKSQRLGELNEGGAGVTIVELT